MNEQEINQIITMVSERNGKELSILDTTALLRELPDADMGETIDRLSRLAATERWITAAHILGNAGADAKPEKGKYHDAEIAWAEVHARSETIGGRLELLSQLRDLEFEDPYTVGVLFEIRRTFKTGVNDEPEWAFKKAYNRAKQSPIPSQIPALLEYDTEPAAMLDNPEHVEGEIRPGPGSNPEYAKQELAKMHAMLGSNPNRRKVDQNGWLSKTIQSRRPGDPRHIAEGLAETLPEE